MGEVRQDDQTGSRVWGVDEGERARLSSEEAYRRKKAANLERTDLGGHPARPETCSRFWPWASEGGAMADRQVRSGAAGEPRHREVGGNVWSRRCSEG